MLKIRDQIKVLSSYLQIVDRGEKKYLLFMVAISALFSLLDLFAMALVGLLGALSVTGVQSQNPTGRLLTLLKLLRIDNFEFQFQIAAIAILTVLALITRTIISLTLVKKIYKRLAKQSAKISETLFNQMVMADYSDLKKIGFVELNAGINAGVNSAVLGVLGTSVTIISELILLLVMTIGIIAIDPISAILTFSLVLLGLLSLNRRLGSKNRILSQHESQLNLSSEEKFREFYFSYRESLVYGRQEILKNRYVEERNRLSDVLAELTLMPSLTKYFVESIVILLVLVYGGLQFLFYDARHAIAGLGILLLVSARVVPSMLRVQQGTLFIKRSSALGQKTLNLINGIDSAFDLGPVGSVVPKWFGGISLRGVNFRYPDDSKQTISNLSLEIKPLEFVAIVGPSGGGKSTLLDLMLGVVSPDSGSIQVSGHSPRICFESFPNKIAYVSQLTPLIRGSIQDNLNFLEAGLDFSHLADSSSELKLLIEPFLPRLNEEVSSSESSLSVGQVQRLGIARALIRNPELLILDEPTSALDAQTEAVIASAIENLRSRCTIVVVAHRLSTVVRADRIIYLEKGQIVASGSFTDLRLQVPDFDKQAKLMGL